jgi:hypothetical protein
MIINSFINNEMTYKQFENEFQMERRLLSIGSALLMGLILAIYAYNNPVEATQAVEQAADVFASVIRGVAN